MRALVLMLLITSCQSAEDRDWSDIQVIMEHTQPRK